MTAGEWLWITALTVRTRLENLPVNEPFQDAPPSLQIDGSGIEIVFHDVIRRYQDRRERSRQQIAIRVAGVPHAHVPVSVQHSLVGKDAIGCHQVFEERRIDDASGSGWRLRDDSLWHDPGIHCQSEGRSDDDTCKTDHASPSDGSTDAADRSMHEKGQRVRQGPDLGAR